MSSEGVPPTEKNKSEDFTEDVFDDLQEGEALVGAEKTPDGSWDFSRSAVMKMGKDEPKEEIQPDETSGDDVKSIFSDRELNNLSIHLGVRSEFERHIRFRQIAKEKGVTSDDVQREITRHNVSMVRENENGVIRHFHRTSLDNLESIAEMGRLVSKAKLRELRPEFDIPVGSTADEVQMTRDRFDVEGNLVRPGLIENGPLGASGSGATIVFKDSVMDLDNYDMTGPYPSAVDLPLEEYCETILVDSEEEREKVLKMLIKNNIIIPVEIKSNWSRE